MRNGQWQFLFSPNFRGKQHWFGGFFMDVPRDASRQNNEEVKRGDIGDKDDLSIEIQISDQCAQLRSVVRSHKRMRTIAQYTCHGYASRTNGNAHVDRLRYHRICSEQRAGNNRTPSERENKTQNRKMRETERDRKAKIENTSAVNERERGPPPVQYKQTEKQREKAKAGRE